ncbi:MULTISPECIES: DUF3105 domain-containing protein [Actinokineospora]|uniref:DUF3105 domain-containing protein n=1 Tax=Actinokineospora fastidiosa TaxID=1816 RepID=A0A918GRS2_9PSEU|nr:MULTISPECIES: DUF3105 domain-containing protein [Actinokineospora]UVS81404.1 hypothetical protein Actkin_05161 [Actinokineospora sp. UTMC 2448]GGS53329.1 hypothetical protein GCM10010171_55800 [Actinokineospora fastidiosa]
MANKTKNKGGKAALKAARASVVSKKGLPWGTIAAVAAVVLIAAGVFGYAYVQIDSVKEFTVSEENKDPSENIDGVVRAEYAGSQHVNADQRVAYDQSPPFGGPHDNYWADCSGIVYPVAVRNENMVHSLEHGAVWIAYNPDQVSGAALDTLKAKVEGQPHMMMSPYPGLDSPISLQSWGHQLKLSDANDERIDQFIRSLRANRFQNPEPGGRCDTGGTGFDPANPPPFVAEAPGPDAVKMDGSGIVPQEESEMTTTGAPTPTTTAAQPTQ